MAISADQLPGYLFTGGLQPWSEVVLPPVDGEAGMWPMSMHHAMGIPALSRGIGLIADLIRIMPMQLVRGDTVQTPTPTLLQQPAPDAGTSWWVGCQVEDYLLHGNALHYITSRGHDGYPLSAAWIPATWVSILWDDDSHTTEYWVGGRQLRTDDVVHVRRGADRTFVHRGIGVLEQHMSTWQKAHQQDAYESRQLTTSSVPSVAVIAANPDLSQEEADKAKQQWIVKYSGATREPAILPAGTEIKTLSWSPNDSQMVEARKLSLQDIANALHMDGFWLGAESAGLQYKSMGPMFTHLLRQTINPVLADFEDRWSMAWTPRGNRIRFDRRAATRDDFATELKTISDAVAQKIITLDEGREYLNLPPAPADLKAAPIARSTIPQEEQPR